MAECRLVLIPLGEEMSWGELARFRPWVPEVKWDRLKAFLHWQDRQRTVLGYSLANYLLGEAGLARREIKLEFDYYGKPHLVEQPQEVYFNLSHAGEWIACGLHTVLVGVDVERVQKIDLQVAERFFAPQEVEDLFALPAAQQQEYFFTLWALKESYIKAVGKGISIPLDSFWFRVSPKGEISFQAKDDQRPWQFRLYDAAGPNYKLAICALSEELPEQVELVSAAEICEE